MAIHDKHYTGTSVSRTLSPGERSLDTLVYQSGKPVLDSELNLSHDVAAYAERLLQSRHIPSGFLRGQTTLDSSADYHLQKVGDADFQPDSFLMKKMVASVAGRPVVVEFTESDIAGTNRINLAEAPISEAVPGDVKRTDFVFLEVWLAQVAPSPWAKATLQLGVNGDGVQLIVDGDQIVLTDHNGVATTLEAKDSPDPMNPLEFEIGANVNTTAVNLAAAIDHLAEYKADASGDVVMVRLREPGAAGNAAFIDVTLGDAGAVILNHGDPAPSNFHSGEDRPNKPTQEHLYRHGNTQAPVGVCLVDDLIDQAVGVESAQRVQVQYRIRKTGNTEGVNFKIEPDGFSCPQVLAQGSSHSPVSDYQFVPADGKTILNKSSAEAYGREDSGLWVAGDGSADAASELGSVDGFVYAIPICFVFRRNNAYVNGSGEPAQGEGFHPRNNTNGAVPHNHSSDPVWHGNSFIGNVPNGHSDRPDGAFCDTVEAWDILDLRRHVMPSGTDVSAELRRQMQSLLDGSLFTWAIDGESKNTLGSGSGDVGTRFLVCDEIGREEAHGGGDKAGSTEHGNLIRNFDHISRRFGDQQVVERVVFEFHCQDLFAENNGKYVEQAVAGNKNWFEGDKIVLDLSNLNASTLNDWDAIGYAGTYFGKTGAGFSVHDLMPPGTVITDVLSVFHDDGNTNAPVNQEVQLGVVEGLGTAIVELTLDANNTEVNGGVVGEPAYKMVGNAVDGDVGSPRRIFVELEITFPLGAGVTDTPDLPVQPSSPDVYPYGALVENDKTQRSPEMERPTEPLFREGFREVKLEQVSNNGDSEAPIEDYIVSSTESMLRFPRRIYGSKVKQVAVTDGNGDAYALRQFATETDPGTEYGSSSRLAFTESKLPTDQHLCRIQYFAQDPIPNHGLNGAGYQVSIYYRSNSPQTCGVHEGVIGTEPHGGPLPTNLKVEILSQSEEVWSGQIGMGSLELGFPYVAPLDQVPVLGGEAEAIFPGEWHLCGSTSISVDDFDANTGLLALHPFVQADTTGTLSLGSVEHPPVRDSEFRAMYTFADDETYRPTVFSQSLSGIARHKVMYPVLARALEDSRLFRKGEVLLVVLSRWGVLDDENTVRFTNEDNRTCAAVYRTKDLLLTVGD